MKRMDGRDVIVHCIAFASIEQLPEGPGLTA